MGGPRGRKFKSNKPTQKPAIGAVGAAGVAVAPGASRGGWALKPDGG